MPRLPVGVSYCCALLGVFTLFATSSALAQTGLHTNGTSQYVTFGTAAPLGTPTFTLELWFKREAAGASTNTGTGGHAAAIPLIAKGRGEADGDTRDMNYFLGLRASDGLLVADYVNAAYSSSRPFQAARPSRRSAIKDSATPAARINNTAPSR